MLTIKKTTRNDDWNTTKEEILHFEDFNEMGNHFWAGYIEQLKRLGWFAIDYCKYGDPRMADSWNGSIRYELL